LRLFRCGHATDMAVNGAGQRWAHCRNPATRHT